MCFRWGMSRLVRTLPVVFVLCTVLPVSAVASAQPLLTFDERVQAQESIERVYYGHQLEATRPFEDVFRMTVAKTSSAF